VEVSSRGNQYECFQDGAMVDIPNGVSDWDGKEGRKRRGTERKVRNKVLYRSLDKLRGVRGGTGEGEE